MRKKTLLFYLFMCLVSSAQINLNNGLVAYYPFNGNAKDMSNNGNDGIVHGATLTPNRLGIINSAYNFNGSSYISTPVMSGFTTQLSLCAWFKTSYCDYYGLVCSRYGNYASTDISTDKYGQPNFHMYDGNSSNITATSVSYSGINLNDNNWHLLVGTFDGLNRKLYVDGVLKSSLSNYYYSLDIQYPFLIGYDPLPAYNRYFNGSIDDVRIYNRAITSDEVVYLFNSADKCQSSYKTDTTTYLVSSESFKLLSPLVSFVRRDSLKTKIGGCDSIVDRYAKMIYSVATSVTNQLSAANFNVYPNPTKDYMFVEVSNENAIIILRNEIGSLIETRKLKEKNSTINMVSYPKGLYIIQLLDSNGTMIATRKLVKM